MLSRKKKTVISQVHTSEPPVPVAQYVPNGAKGRKSLPETLGKRETNNPALVKSSPQVLPTDNINPILNAAIPRLGKLISAPDSPERSRELKKLLHCLNDVNCIHVGYCVMKCALLLLLCIFLIIFVVCMKY